MSQEIEIEYKVLLTKEQFDNLNNKLPFPKEPITQINHYFETNNFELKDARSALRIRQKGNQYVLTLKEPFEDAILETHDALTEAEFLKWINGTPIKKSNTTKQLEQLGIQAEALNYYGSLKTDRKSYTENEVIYVLDKSYYNDIIDYELEIEAPSHEIGIAVIQSLIKQFEISEINNITKIERFFNSFI